MIADFTLMMWGLAIAVPIYWAIPDRLPVPRLYLLILPSVLLLFLLSPLILIIVGIYALFIPFFVIARHVGRIPADRLKQVSWIVFLPLALAPSVPAELWADALFGSETSAAPALTAFAYLGLSYTAIRVFILVREFLNGQKTSVTQTLAALLFFGSFSAGPIIGGEPYRNVQSRPSLKLLSMGLARIGWGVALFVVAKPFVEGIEIANATGADGRLLVWLEMYRDFLVLYIDFTGYSDIAIGAALLFGITLPENFRWPLVATSVQEFWQRWHLSLGAFIGTYLFKPFVRTTGKPARAIFLAFTCVGLWHAISIPYLIWGIGHGAALALNMMIRKSSMLDTRRRSMRLLISLAGWVFTMSYVSLLSGFAGHATLDEALAFLDRLLRPGQP